MAARIVEARHWTAFASLQPPIPRLPDGSTIGGTAWVMSRFMDHFRTHAAIDDDEDLPPLAPKRRTPDLALHGTTPARRAASCSSDSLSGRRL